MRKINYIINTINYIQIKQGLDYNLFNSIRVKDFICRLEQKIENEINQSIIYQNNDYSELINKLLEEYSIEKLSFEKKIERPSTVHNPNFVENGKIETEFSITYFLNQSIKILSIIPSKIYTPKNKLIFIRDGNNNKYISYRIKLTDKLIENPETIRGIDYFIERNIQYLNIDFAKWNEHLKNLLIQKLENYQNIKNKFTNLFKELKINSISNNFIQVISKKIIPTNSKTKNLISISDEIYNDIIKTIGFVGRAIESKRRIYLDAYEKKAYSTKAEREDYFRDIFQLFLETRYEYTSVNGETFNKEGKADITIKNTIDNNNLFVAECKIWDSIDWVCDSAIKQLMGYITLRETKTALLIFIKDREFTKKSKSI